jgi:hypothetical protein
VETLFHFRAISIPAINKLTLGTIRLDDWLLQSALRLALLFSLAQFSILGLQLLFSYKILLIERLEAKHREKIDKIEEDLLQIKRAISENQNNQNSRKAFISAANVDIEKLREAADNVPDFARDEPRANMHDQSYRNKLIGWSDVRQYVQGKYSFSSSDDDVDGFLSFAVSNIQNQINANAINSSNDDRMIAQLLTNENELSARLSDYRGKAPELKDGYRNTEIAFDVSRFGAPFLAGISALAWSFIGR